MTEAAAVAVPERDSLEDRTPMAFLPYQQRWAADRTPVKVCQKSRRIGLSWSEAGDSALLCSSRSGMNTFYIGYTKDMAKEFIHDCASFAAAYDLAAGEITEAEEVWFEGEERKSVFVFTLRFASGWRIEALSSTPRNLRGKQGRVIIDEAAFHPDIAELLKAALALLIWGGEVHVISTHDGAENPFNELCQDILAGRVPYSLHTITFDDAIAAGLYERVCLRTGRKPTAESKAKWIAEIRAQYRDNAAEELDCIPKNSGGAWLSRALIEARMEGGAVLRWRPPEEGFVLWSEHQRTAEMKAWLDEHLAPQLALLDPTLKSYIGSDFGRTGDLSVKAPMQLGRNLVRRIPFTLELKNCPFDQQWQAYQYLADGLPNFTHAKLDARGNGQYLAEKALQKYGPQRIECVMLSQTWYRENCPHLKAAFEDATISLMADADTLDDLRAFQVVRGIPLLPDVRSKGADGNQRHGDAGVAVLLAHAASRAECPPPAGADAEPEADTYRAPRHYARHH